MISLIVPTFNEAENIKALVPKICRFIKQPFEIIIIDDGSPDGTGQIAQQLAKKYPIRVVHRKKKQGLATAVLDGFAFSLYKMHIPLQDGFDICWRNS